MDLTYLRIVRINNYLVNILHLYLVDFVSQLQRWNLLEPKDKSFIFVS